MTTLNAEADRPEKTGQVILITGASSGIGEALARSFSQKRVNLILCARRLEKLKDLARSLACPCRVLKCDLSREAERRSLFETVQEEFGRLDMLINNAGLGCFCNFMETKETLWRELMEVNLFAPVFLARLFLPMMLTQNQGLIVNMASIGGLVAHSEKVSPYVASKHALVGFSRALAKDLAHTGVRVKAVCPHLTATEFFDKGQGASEMHEVLDDIKGFMDRPEEVARGIIKRLEEPGVVLFPTEKPAKAFRKMRDV